MERPGRPVLVSVHVPKCAGTSVRLYFERALGRGHRNLYVDRTSFVFTEEQLWSEALGDPEVRSISAHFIRVSPPVVRYPLGEGDSLGQMRVKICLPGRGGKKKRPTDEWGEHRWPHQEV